MAAQKKTKKPPVGSAAPTQGLVGSPREEASLAAPRRRMGLPRDYAEALGAIKRRIQQERLRAVLAASSTMVLLYWDIGRMILDRQQREGWGARVIDRLARDLCESYPDTRGFSARNLLFMRSFADAFRDSEKVKHLVSQLPWGHLVRLLQRVKDPGVRELNAVPFDRAPERKTPRHRLRWRGVSYQTAAGLSRPRPQQS